MSGFCVLILLFSTRSSIKTFYSIGLSILLIAPNKIAEARGRFLASNSAEYCKEPLNQLWALFAYYKKFVEERIAATGLEPSDDDDDDRFRVQCSYSVTAFDRCESAVADDQPRFDLASAVNKLLTSLQKLIDNVTCPLAAYFWILVDNFVSFGQRILNACFVFTDFCCHVLTHLRSCDFDAEFLRDAKRVDVQHLLDQNFDRLANHLATLTAGLRR